MVRNGKIVATPSELIIDDLATWQQRLDGDKHWEQHHDGQQASAIVNPLAVLIVIVTKAIGNR